MLPVGPVGGAVGAVTIGRPSSVVAGGPDGPTTNGTVVVVVVDDDVDGVSLPMFLAVRPSPPAAAIATPVPSNTIANVAPTTDNRRCCTRRADFWTSAHEASSGRAPAI